MEIKISNKKIGPGNPVFIIIEIGSNYNRDFDTAKRMIDLIKESGADAAKFQIFKEKRLYTTNAGKVDYLKRDIIINDLVKNAEVENEMHKRLFDYCCKKNLLYLCTPTDDIVADYLEGLGVEAYKIASYDLTNHFLLKHVAKKGKPVIVSTGAGNSEEVEGAIRVIKEAGSNNIVLLQCVAQYPADYKYTNLKLLEKYSDAFHIPVGISDHSADPFIVPYAAAALGANVIEKHFTLNRNQDGPDHAFAIEPDELKRMVDGIRKVELSMGDGNKRVALGEEELRRFAHRCVFATADIGAGEKISRKNSDVLRPGKKERGIDAAEYEKVLGSAAKKNIKEGDPIKREDV